MEMSRISCFSPLADQMINSKMRYVDEERAILSYHKDLDMLGKNHIGMVSGHCDHAGLGAAYLDIVIIEVLWVVCQLVSRFLLT